MQALLKTYFYTYIYIKYTNQKQNEKLINKINNNQLHSG